MSNDVWKYCTEMSDKGFSG
uniref:Uncharacterized protein n=1 Tax=Arundo donax TaxID=35708 RepID=A0A0A8Z105_ARUDO